MGSGFKTFTAGSVLTASDVQNYLQDQAVMVFGGTAARSSAIGTANFEEGMLTYLTDVDKLQVYTGSSFQDVYPPAATSQGMTLINTTSFSAVASQALNSIFSATYDNYRIVLNITSNSADASIDLKLRSGVTDNSTAYSYGRITINRTGTSGTQTGNDVTTGWRIGEVDGDAPAHFFQCVLDIGLPFTSQYTTLNQVGSFITTTTQIFGTAGGGAHGSGVSYDGVNIIPTAGNITGSVSVYGYNK